MLRISIDPAHTIDGWIPSFEGMTNVGDVDLTSHQHRLSRERGNPAVPRLSPDLGRPHYSL